MSKRTNFERIQRSTIARGPGENTVVKIADRIRRRPIGQNVAFQIDPSPKRLFNINIRFF